MKKIREKQPTQNGLEVSSFISEGNPNIDQKADETLEFANAQASEAKTQERDRQLVNNIQLAIEKETFLLNVVSSVEIMANSGVVILEGTVFTEEEKAMIGQKAAAFAGVNNITNNLEVIAKG